MDERSALHIVEDDLRDEPWIEWAIEELERRLAAEVAMDAVSNFLHQGV